MYPKGGRGSGRNRRFLPDRALPAFSFEGLDLLGGRAPQFAPLGHVESAAAMDGGAVVPNHEITDLPIVAINKFALGRMLE